MQNSKQHQHYPSSIYVFCSTYRYHQKPGWTTSTTTMTTFNCYSFLLRMAMVILLLLTPTTNSGNNDDDDDVNVQRRGQFLATTVMRIKEKADTTVKC